MGTGQPSTHYRYLGSACTCEYSNPGGRVSARVTISYARFPPLKDGCDSYGIRIAAGFPEPVWEKAQVSVRVEGDGGPLIESIWPDREFDPDSISLREWRQIQQVESESSLYAKGAAIALLPVGLFLGGIIGTRWREIRQDSQIESGYDVTRRAYATGTGKGHKQADFELYYTPGFNDLRADNNCYLLVHSRQNSPVWIASCILRAYPKPNMISMIKKVQFWQSSLPTELGPLGPYLL